MAMLGRGIVNNILNAATSTGAGSTMNVPTTKPYGGDYTTTFGWQVNTNGTFTALTVELQGSLDGANWSTVDTNSTVTGGARVVTSAPYPFLRANVTTYTGGASVSVLLTLGDI